MFTLFQRKNGFTLVELIVVITVIGILTGGAALSITANAKQSRDTRRKTDLQQIKSALEFYRADQTNGNYPLTLPTLVPTHIEKIPEDPNSTASSPRNYLYVPSPSGCNNTTTFCSSYTLTASTETLNLGAGGTGTYTVTPLSIQ